MELIDAKTIIMRTKAFNLNYLAAEYHMNIYHGCSHGCIYCFARSAYYKINDFDCVRAKKDALKIIRDELQRKVKRGVISTGGVSDPYNPQEAEYRLTRNSLELINAFSFGTSMLTKSNLVTRDIDVLSNIREHSPVNISFSITCSNDETSRKIEPFTATSDERFMAINQLVKNGIVAGVLMNPIVPYLTDNEENVRGIVKKASYYGAKYIYASMQVTMEGIQRDYFYQEAEKILPGISEKYRERYKEYYYCKSPHARKLYNAFTDECEKQKIIYDMRAANQVIRAGYVLSEFDFID